MEKLVKLLNKRLKEDSRLKDYYSKFYTEYYCGGEIVHIYGKSKCKSDFDQDFSKRIYQKDFGFIDRLVLNNYIAVLNIDNRIALSEFTKAERVVMRLSVSDTPLQDLLYILK